MKHFKGRQILLLGLVALVIVAGYYRWTLESKGETVPVMTDALPAGEGDNALPANGEAEPSGEISKNDAVQSSEGADTSDYFAQSKQNRDIARSESMEVFKGVTSDSNADKESKEQANAKLTAVAESMAKESTIEGLVKSKGFEDCFVTIDDSGVNVVVKGNQLEKDTVAQIKDIVIAQTGVKAGKIRISNAQ